MKCKFGLPRTTGFDDDGQMKIRLALAISVQAVLLEAAERPNIVWIVSEDTSKHYLKLFDENGAAAPNIEALAAHGLTFTRAFSNSPVCSVARTTLATGAYAPRLGTQFHRRSKTAALPDDLRAFSAYLRDAGYYTTNRSKEDYNFVKFPDTWDDSSEKADWRNRPDLAQPFFHMESHAESHEGSLHFDRVTFENEKTVHNPAEVTLPPYFPDTPLFRYTFARYLDRMQIIDGIVGETVAKLKEDHLLEDTFVFYFGDHGGVLPRSKGYLYDSGLHIPLVIRIPDKWKHLVDATPGSEVSGFVSFIDFAPTVLNLAGVGIPAQMDGQPFLGKDIKSEELAARDSTLGYADRFDEKYDLCRSLRIGDWKYIRSYQPYYADGLQNNYRYAMLAYREWRDLYREGKLGSDQRQFFEPKTPEMLFDLSNDPHEVKNLAAEPAHRSRLLSMRSALRERLKALPDLGFIPECTLYDEAMGDPVGYGEAHADEIATLVDTADLMLNPFAQSEDGIKSALISDDSNVRYWATGVCSAFGIEASDLNDLVRPLLGDASAPVRVRAAEFLGITGAIDPRATLIGIVNGTEHPVEKLIALQSAAFFHDHSPLVYPFEPEAFTPVVPQGEAERRIQYFSGDWIKRKQPKANRPGESKP